MKETIVLVDCAGWSPAQLARLAQLEAGESWLGYWNSNEAGQPGNGGVPLPIAAAPGVIHTTAGPLRATCGERQLHATRYPLYWEGERVWVVALSGEVRGDELKAWSLEREIIGEVQPHKNSEAGLRASLKQGGDLSYANLTNANLSYADLTGADLTGADLTGANLTGADLSGVDLIAADLTGADLSGANLSGVGLRKAVLRGSNLSGVDLRKAVLRGSNLSGADLTYANLSGADLTGANLTGADLTGANLRNADLRGANLRGANLTRTKIS